MTEIETCARCGAWLSESECHNCRGVEPTLMQAHLLLNRIMAHWMYGDGNLRILQRDVEVWCRVAGAPK